MPFNNYAPQYVFKGQVQSDTAPSANNDLVRKQDVSGLSYISSIAASSSSYLSVDSNGALSVSNLLVTDVIVNTTDSTLSAYISNSAAGDNLGKGDIVILTAPTDSLMYIVKAGTGSQASDYEEIQSSLTAAEIVALLTGGTGISVASNGTIAIDFSEFDTDSITEGSSNLFYSSSLFDTDFGGKSTSDLSEGSNLYYTDARARASVSASGDLSYNSSTGVFNVVTYKTADFNTDFAAKDTDNLSEGSTNLYFTDARARAAFSSGNGISINNSGVVAARINTGKGIAFDAGNNNSLQMNISSDFAFDGSNGELLFNLDTDGIQEGSTSLFFTDARARAAFSGGDGIAYNSSTGAFSADLGDGLLIDLSGRIGLDLGAGLEIDSVDQRLKVQDSHFRKEFASQSFTANTAKTINHNLGKKYVHVSVYDSSDQLVHAQVTLTDANNLSITTSDGLTGVTVVVSI